MAVINLDNLQGVPSDFLRELNEIKPILRRNNFLENLLNNSKVSSLIRRINDYCLENQVYGYHYTRAFPEEIKTNGLTCRKGEEIRTNFLNRFKSIFTDVELKAIKESWVSHFDAQQQKYRDNLLFFNFTTHALRGFGAEPLLSNYGGEQIYMPLQEFENISQKIKKIGQPIILKCKLNPVYIKTFYENPWGRIAVSTYHCQINPDAHRDDQDGHQSVNVKPEDIEIITYEGRMQYR